MNKHKNKNKTPKQVPANLRLTERDHMPLEVANDLVVNPEIGAPLRREAFRSREKHYESTTQPKPIDEKLDRRFRTATLVQLGKWLTRTAHREVGVTKRLLEAEGLLRRALDKHAAALATATIQHLHLQSVAIAATAAALGREITRRKNSCVVPVLLA
jgi:hypothetical protein